MKVFRQSLILAVFLLMSIAETVGQTGIPRIVINTLGHSGKIYNILFSPDGERIISVSEDKTIRVWDARTAELVTKFESQIGNGPEGMLYASAISPDGKLLAVSGYPVSSEKENYIVLIDLEKGQQVATAVGHSNVINSLDFNGRGNYLASGSDDGTIRIWKVDNTKILRTVTTIEIGSRVTGVSFNNRTQALAVASDNKNVLLYNLTGLDSGIKKFPHTQLKKHKGIVNKVAVAPDGNYIASSSMDNELILWKADGSFVKEFDRVGSVINALTFSHDSKILVAMDAAGGGVSYSVPEGNKWTDFIGHDNTVFSADFSPASISGNYVVASAGGNDNVIQIWNPINGRTQQTIKGKGATIWDLAFGAGMELYVARQQPRNNANATYNFLFDLNSFTIKRDPGKPVTTFLKDANKDVKQTSAYSLEVSRGGIIKNSEFEDGRILDFQVTPDGNVIVGSDFSLKMYNRQGQIVKEFMGHTGGVRSVTVSRDGRYMASGSEDQTIRLWKLAEKGEAPSMRDVFQDPVWGEYFASLEVDSLTYTSSTKAWREVISYLKGHGDKTWKDIEEVFSTLGETVAPFANLFIADDSEWICWAPEGYFSCSSSGGEYFGWHVNKGIHELADFYTAEQYFDILYRPETLVKSIGQGRRVVEILTEEGERIFDLTKLSRPSAAFFNTNALTFGKDKKLDYTQGKFFTQSQSLDLTVDIYDGGGGVKEVNVYQNEKLIIIDDEFESLGEGQKVEKSYHVDLVNGANDFRVVVKNYQKIESRPDHLKVEYNGEIIATSSLYILSVGINKYKNAAYNLNYAQPDAKSFTKKVIENGSKMFKTVRKTEIYDTEATKENIIKGFESIIAQAQPEDVFVFYYAGHGTLDEENDNEYYLVPTDITKLYGDPAQLQARGVSATNLKRYLSQIRSQKQLILMDACHSGGAMKSMKVRAAASEEKAIVQLARASGVVMLASSETQQFAAEFEVLKHGVFTYALLEALDGAADNGDNKVTVNELKIYMDERVPELSNQYGGQAQYPTGFVHGNDFPISLIYSEQNSED
ncbi:WD40 repeat protein [Fulvivirga imtechensis AK7]|uniref:WD40 repeat protein n=1 Tax=Fulvivirga imtechensis AK7 TaxID=1237149 RepID=L8JXB0_9BACT|nr:caspase family protein [Fulvivirga imtechensis]ELR72239.1 WD40 repeat protein [Fulvivirga imtechensis AK7]